MKPIRDLCREPAFGAAILLIACAWAGRGFLNGDIAAYCAQAWTLDLQDRSVHLGYVAIAAVVAGLADRALPLALDGLNIGAAMLGAVSATRLLSASDDRSASGLVAAGLFLPWAAFAEVDVPWMALVLTSAVGAPGAAFAAVAISPTALLAMPWVVGHRRVRRPAERLRAFAPLFEAALAILLLTAVSSGEWWWGDRGVLAPRPWLLGRNLGTWLATVPWLVVATARPPRALVELGLLAPLLLAPADVPVAVLVGVAATAAALRDAPELSTLGRAARIGAVAAVVASGWLGGHRRALRIEAEHASLLAIHRRFAPGDGIVAPFTWGARLAVVATGDPYGLPWHPEGRFLRDQRRAWESVDGTIHVLPPSAEATVGRPPRSLR